MKNYTKHVLKYPSDPFLHNNLGFFAAHVGDYDKAISHFTKAIKLLPNYTVAYSNRATVYLWKKEEKKALRDCIKFTQLRYAQKTLEPQLLFEGIYARFFYWYCERGGHEKIYQWYEQLLDLFPSMGSVLKQRILKHVHFQILYRQLIHLPKKYDKQIILKQYRDIWKLYRQIQKESIFSEHQDWFSAEEYQSLHLDCRSILKNIKMRDIFYQRICITHPTASIFNEMGCEVVKWDPQKDTNGRIRPYYGELALHYFNQALRHDKTYAPAYYNKARVYASNHEYEKAIENYTKGILLAPEQICAYAPRHDRYMELAYENIDHTATWRNNLSKKNGLSSEELASVRSVNEYSNHYIGKHVISKSEHNITYIPKAHEDKAILAKARFYAYIKKYRKALSCIQATELGIVLGFLEGVCLYKLGRYQEALEPLSHSLSAALEDDINAQANQALCYAKCGNIEKSVKCLDFAFECLVEALELKALKNGPLLNVINVEMTNKNLIGKIREYFDNYYKQCAEQNKLFDISYLMSPLFSDYIDNAYFQRAECYFSLKDYTHAIEDYRRALHPDDMFPTVLIPNFESHIKERIKICREKLKILKSK